MSISMQLRTIGARGTKHGLAAGAVLAISGAAEAAVYFSTDFASGYSPGRLQGQNGWKSTYENINPIQVSAGRAVLGQSGQDLYRNLDTPAPTTPGTTLYFSASLQVNTASFGNYFLHVSDPAGTQSGFFGRVYAKSSGTGFVFGIRANNGAIGWGSQVLTFNTDHQVVVAWDFIAGPENDTCALYVDPSSTERSALSAYATAAFNNALNEPASQVAAINLRQGDSGSPTVLVSTLAAGSTLEDVGVVPSPGALALFSTAGLMVRRRRQA